MEEEIFEQRIDLSELSLAVEAIRQSLGSVIIGQQDMIDYLIAGILADGHILIEGVPGVAKTLSAKLLAKCVEADFSRIQFTPDLMPSDILGTSVFNPKDSSFEFKKGPIFGNIILVDEINRAPAKTQSALFEVMEERQITMDGKTYKMSEPFMVLATQNPIEQEGTYRLPEAQLDRFLFKVEIKYPTLEEETRLLIEQHQQKTDEKVDGLQPVLTSSQIIQLRKQVLTLFVKPEILKFTAQIVHNTRMSKSLYLGASPRASLAVVNSAKAFAAMNGRDFVTPEDVIKAIKPVLRHRVMLTADKEMEGVSPDEILDQLVHQIEVPR